MRRSHLYNPKLKLLARKMRNEMTAAERKLWYEYLRQDKHKWLRQKPIGNYILDFYCPEFKLAVEIDGTTHLENKDMVHDQIRTEELEKLSIKVLRFWNDDVLEGLAVVASIIEEEIVKRKKLKSPLTPFDKGGVKFPQHPLIKGANLLIILFVAISFGLAVAAQAHQPRYVTDNQVALIKKPDVSQAFYGELKGSEAYYLIDLKQAQDLYFQILVPDLPEIRKDKTVSVEYAPDMGAKAVSFAKLDPASSPWKNFYEEFAGDNYWQGPEIKKSAESGYYLIKVSSPDNSGKYVLVVGEKEEFPVAEAVKALIIIPQLKVNFFNKPIWQSFNSKIGRYFFIGLGVLVIFGFMFRKFNQVYK